MSQKKGTHVHKEGITAAGQSRLIGNLMKGGKVLMSTSEKEELERILAESFTKREGRSCQVKLFGFEYLGEGPDGKKFRYEISLRFLE